MRKVLLFAMLMAALAPAHGQKKILLTDEVKASIGIWLPGGSFTGIVTDLSGSVTNNQAPTALAVKNWVALYPGTVTSFSAGTLSPLFTTSVANAGTTPALTFTASTAAQNAVLAGPSSGGTGAYSFRALLAADIPNLDAAKITTGTLGVARGGTGAATLTGYLKGNGTSAFTAAATVPVADISGTLPVANGGTGAATLTGYLKGNGTSAFTAAATVPPADIAQASAAIGQVLKWNGSAWAPGTDETGGGGGGTPATIVTGIGTQDFNSTAASGGGPTTMTNIAGLSFAVTSGKKYRVRGHIVYGATATGVGISLGITCPGNFWVSYVLPQSGTAAKTGAASSGYNDSVRIDGTSSPNGSGTPNMAFFECILNATSSGTFQVQAAAEPNTGASNVISTQTNSSLVIQEI